MSCGAAVPTTKSEMVPQSEMPQPEHQHYSRPRQAQAAGACEREHNALAKPVALAVMATLGVLLGADAVRSERCVPVAARTPGAAVRAAFQAGAAGSAFNSYNFGGYLIYEGMSVFIDGRADMYDGF